MFDELWTDLLEFVRGAGDFGVGAVRLEVVDEHTLPVGLLPGWDGGPVPVLDHVGAAGEVRVDIEAELAVVGRILVGGSPIRGLGVGFGDEVVLVLEGAGVSRPARLRWPSMWSCVP